MNDFPFDNLWTKARKLLSWNLTRLSLICLTLEYWKYLEYFLSIFKLCFRDLLRRFMPRGSPKHLCIFACHKSKINPRIHSFSIAFPPITKQISVIRNNNLFVFTVVFSFLLSSIFFFQLASYICFTYSGNIFVLDSEVRIFLLEDKQGAFRSSLAKVLTNCYFYANKLNRRNQIIVWDVLDSFSVYLAQFHHSSSILYFSTFCLYRQK